mgnify:CR=1 FL=1
MFGRILEVKISAYAPPEGVSGLQELFLPLRRQSYAMLLLSGGGLDCARYSIMGWDPFLVLEAKRGRVCFGVGPEPAQILANPFTVLEDLLGQLELPGPAPLAPLAAGGLGFFAYDLKNHLERLPATAVDDLRLPEMVVAFPRALVVHDRWENRYTRVEVVYEDRRGRQLPPAAPLPAPGPAAGGYQVGPPASNFTREAYLAAVRRIRDYIRQGDVYQVNLSQRFAFPFRGDPYALFLQLFARNPAPFFAYLNGGDFVILSTSMERFLWRREERVETRPIKGTRPRGRTPAEDEAHRQELATSPKDDAELSMIVDLLRNDLGKVCRPRTVRVAEHKRLEAYENVYHLVSIVTGELKSGVGHVDLLRAAFPGGSITGCPKIRAMEIIDELEPTVRHVYTGAIGYLGLNRTLDLNVAIRTAILTRGRGYFSVGGGVVYDSHEVAEYEETLHKGRTLFRLLAGEEGPAQPEAALSSQGLS